MADPRLLPPTSRRQTLSPLLQAQAAATQGEKVNFCPYKCEDRHLDEHGYCKHLVGFTNDGKVYEPMVRVKGGRRVVRVDWVPTGEFVESTEVDDDGNETLVKVEEKAPRLEPVLKTDVLVPISISSRVYRKDV